MRFALWNPNICPVPLATCFMSASLLASIHGQPDNSHEIRLKPYRDLYTIAAQQLGIRPSQLKNVVGFEDTWAGVTAMRGAGIGVPCAVPFEGTTGHDFESAAHVFIKGVPQALLEHGLFLEDAALHSA